MSDHPAEPKASTPPEAVDEKLRRGFEEIARRPVPDRLMRLVDRLTGARKDDRG